MRTVFIEMGYSEADYERTYQVYSSAIEDFSASQFKIELEKYLEFQPNETLVFIFDEASEAISQKKITLLDLEGISEAMSSVSNKVWTIAIAQEKLDDVINNANVNRSQLTKATDRFKTKIHLESTEVDVIIRSRLLNKTEPGYQKLVDYYKANEGLISDATNLKSSFPTKTVDANEFAVYYPFHKYQFDILQKFLFSSNALVATQVAARGMIITTFDVLRKQMRDKELYCFTPGYAICTEAQTAPPSGLVNKYDTAKKILNKIEGTIDGEKLVKTIHLLADSEVVSPTVENITKSYISDITAYYEVKPEIEKALELLLEAKVLLLSNNNYKITSDLEGKLLEEMNDIDVELFSKKRSLINRIKDYKLFAPVAMFNDGSSSFKFSVISDQDDELAGPGSKQLKLKAYSLFNISENRQDFIDNLKLETQYQKDLITLVPDNKDFFLLDRLIGEVSRYSYMEEKYSNETDPAKRQIIRDFSIIRDEKEKELRVMIEKAYHNASIIYMFDEYLLNADSFRQTISETQGKLVKNIYTKRLSSELSESLIPSIFSKRKEDLKSLFPNKDFHFFDSHGNFVGDSLRVVEEITAKINSRYVDGRTLESDFSGAPWGYSFGTIASTLAALFRAGRISVKYNGAIWFSSKDKGVHDAFTNTTKFKSASFKSITKVVTAAQKNQTVELLIGLDIKTHTGRNVDWNINDFELAESIRNMAEHFNGALITLGDTVGDFETLFPMVANQKQTLSSFSGKITENNYIDKIEFLLANKEQFSDAIKTIIDAQKFIKKNFSDVREWKRFVEEVISELKKADRKDRTIIEAQTEFDRLYKQDMVKNYGSLEQQVQIVKDSYFKLIKNAAERMSHEYQVFSGKVDAAIRTLQNYPAELNVENQKKLEALKLYSDNRIIKEPRLEYSISCKNCGYSLSDILNYIALIPIKENELVDVQNSFIKKEKGPSVGDGPRKITFKIKSKIMTVKEYTELLETQKKALADANPDEKIVLDIIIQ